MSQRKAFNFYLSYFEVFEELPNDKEKLAFITALLNKQFYGEEPDLKGMAKFAYVSQKQVINQQVEGWESKSKTPLRRGGLKGGAEGGSVQVQEEVQEKEEEKGEYTKPTKVDSFDWDVLLSFINEHTKREFRTINDKIKKSFKARLKDGYKKSDIKNAIINASNSEFHKDNGRQHLTPTFFSRATTLDTWASIAKPEPKFDPNANPVN